MEIGSIRDILKTKGHTVYSIAPDKTVRDAIMMMAENDIGALLVMEGSRVIGIITERDYTRKINLKGKSSKETPVKEIMTDAICVKPETSVMEALTIMTNSHVRHLPVLEGENTVGMVSTGDLVKKIISEQQNTIKHLQNYITGSYLG